MSKTLEDAKMPSLKDKINADKAIDKAAEEVIADAKETLEEKSKDKKKGRSKK